MGDRERSAESLTVVDVEVRKVRHDGRIEDVRYPAFPSDRDAENVIAWLDAHPA